MESLNVGCGEDAWGTVRVDLGRTWGGRPSRVTLVADAGHLPFRNRAFSEARCWHMLEHLSDPRRAYAEILRVSRSSDVRFPTEHFLQRAAQSASIWRIRNHRKIVKKESPDTIHRYRHLWTIHPRALGATNYHQVKTEPSFFKNGRKARLFKWLRLPKIIPYEWVVISDAVDVNWKTLDNSV